MSSDIQNRDVITLGSGKEAWWGHQAGKLFAGRLSPMRCLAEGVAAFNIDEVPVMLDGLKLDGVKGLVAMTDNDRWPLSVVGEDYGVMTNPTFWQILEEVYKGQPVVETAGTLGDGRKVWALVAAGEHTVQSGDQLKEFDLWINSFDGSYAFSCLGTMVRVVCQNTLTMAVGKARKRTLTVKHTVNCEAMAKAAANTLATSRDLRLAEIAKMQRLAETPITRDDANIFFRRLLNVESVFGAPTRTLNTLDQLNELFVRGVGNQGETRWDVLNAVTEYADHHRTLRVGDGDRTEARFASALLGSGADLKARAFDMLTV